MARHSRTRWGIASLAIFALLSSKLVLPDATQRGTEPASANASPISTTDAATAGERGTRSRRLQDSGAAAEAKLRSLLEVRGGEISCIRVPADLMAGLPSEMTKGAAADKPSLLGMIPRPAVLNLFKDSADRGARIEGDVDGNDDGFEWKGKRLSVSGNSIKRGQTSTLMLQVAEGEKSLPCYISAPPGSVILLRSSHPDPEGMLLVVGQAETEEAPPLEKAGR